MLTGGAVNWIYLNRAKEGKTGFEKGRNGAQKIALDEDYVKVPGGRDYWRGKNAKKSTGKWKGTL